MQPAAVAEQTAEERQENRQYDGDDQTDYEQRVVNSEAEIERHSLAQLIFRTITVIIPMTKDYPNHIH